MAKLDAIVKRKDMHILDPKKVVVREGWNPRKDFHTDEDTELKQFVIDNGPTFPPIFVKRVKDNVVVVDGERRLRAVLAAIDAGCEIVGIPSLFIDPNANEINQLSLTLSSNQGKALKPMEEAEACKRLQSWGLTNAEIAKRIGKSKAHVTNRLVLVKASPAVAEAVDHGTITQGQAMEAVKESNGSIETQNNKLKKLRKPTAKKAPKIMSRLKIQENLGELLGRVAIHDLTNGSNTEVIKEYGMTIGLTMVLKNIGIKEAAGEVFSAIEDKKDAMAIANGKAPWER